MTLKLFFLTSTAFLSFVSFAQPTWAQNNSDTTNENPKLVAPEVPLSVRRSIASRPDKFLTQIVNRLFQMNETGVVNKHDVNKYKTVQQVKTRSRAMLPFLSLDLDGDGVITASEHATVEKFERNQTRSHYELLFLKGDTDKNGEISYKELVAYADQKIKKLQRHLSGGLDDPLIFDLNGDGKVDSKEVANAIEKITAETPEIRNLAKRRTHTFAQRKTLNRCKLPPVDPAAKVIVVGGYEGSAISTASVAGLNQTTTTATINIEPGKEPLYIIARTYDPFIWRVNGATERVTKFVAAPRKIQEGGGVGVVGLKKDQVAFTESNACGVGYFTKKDDGKARIAQARLSAHLKRDVNKMVGAYELHELSLPSGAIEKARKKQSNGSVTIQSGDGNFLLKDGKFVKLNDGRRGRTARSFNRFYPGGLVQIDHDKVVSPKPAEQYDVLPQQAGLLQLIREGAVEFTRDGFYLIKKDIPRFPAGLAGGHSVKFMIAKGVKMPKGSPGHSKVYSEETGQCIIGVLCR